MSTIASYNKENTFIFKTISKTGDNTKATSLLEWLGSQQDVKLEDQSAFNDHNGSFRGINFQLTGPLAAYYPLLRGLSLSGISKTASLKADHSKRSFTFEYEVNAEPKAKIYLTRLLEVIRKEVRFKQVLGQL